MHQRRARRFLALAAMSGLFFLGVSGTPPARAGGPLAVGGTFGVDGQPFTWDTSQAVGYQTDGPTASTALALGKLTKAQADARIVSMFQVWQNVSTASITFTRLGDLLDTGAFTDGDVNTMAEFDAVEGSCFDGLQNPIVYDVDGSLFTELGQPSGVIGFAGPCVVSSNGVTNRIGGAIAALNGKFLDGAGEPELTDDEFDAVFIHEFGHFAGLDHSQVNVNCLTAFPCGADDQEGLPTMFPILLGALMKTLAPDDEAWISRLYPDPSFDSSFGTISGTIFFSDGETHVQGVNVIARQVDDAATTTIDESRRNAVSVVSGYLFTGNPGQTVTRTNTPGSPFGSRDPSLIGRFDIPGLAPGMYTVEVESINPSFTDGSGVGPLLEPIPSPGPPEFHSGASESDTDNPGLSVEVPVEAGVTAFGIDIILNGTPPRFDSFESARLWLPELPPGWIRGETLAVDRVRG